jgi:hypothetical protein
VLQTVRDACEFDPKAIGYALSEQIEDLDDLIGHDVEKATGFFEKTYVTGGMKTLLRQGLQRLSGSSGQAVFELKQAMGGGKTHSMLALGYLAANPELSRLVPNDVVAGVSLAKTKVVAISGRSISRDRHLWGDVAMQLGKADAFLEFYKGAPTAPNEKDWIALFGDEPTLILIDELPPYLANAVTQIVGGGTLADVTVFALSNLLSAALKLKRLCIVISNLSGSYDKATKEIGDTIRKVIKTIQNEANRQAKAITPVDLGTDEIYHILRKRLLVKEPSPAVVNSVAEAYANAITEAVRSKTIAKSATQISDEIVASYPFHPSFKHILALFKDNERFRQTRGLMTLAAVMVRSAQSRALNDVHLVGCQHVDLADAEIRDVVTNIYDLTGAIAHDIAGSGAEKAHAQVIDEQIESDAASQIARLVLMSSLPAADNAVKGLSKTAVIENLVSPNYAGLLFDDAFEKLKAECWYLHRRDNDAWIFARNENLKKKIEKVAEGAAQPKIDEEMARRLNKVFDPVRKVAYAEMKALPKLSEIKTDKNRLLLVLNPDKKVPPEMADQLFKLVAEKNNFCIVTGDGTDLASLEDKVRRIYAVAKVKAEDGGEASPNLAELNAEEETAEFDFTATLEQIFNRVYYPGRDAKGQPGLIGAPLKFDTSKKRDGALDGEAAIEAALSSIGSSKLIAAIDGTNSDGLIQRAQDVLWVGKERKARWADIVEQSLCNVRWPWLPPKGLETLKTNAVASGTWKDLGDGSVEKGPFPAPKTSVRVSARGYDESTGEAAIEVTAVDAGSKARIHYATNAGVDASSPVLTESTLETREVSLWFVAIDPTGKHETGEAVPWRNTLTLTHEPKEVMGKRTVTLTVRPRGEIRWNLDGTTPREGKVYGGPIEIPGSAEAKVYAYAEADGVSETKTFTIPAVGEARKIDPVRPATATLAAKQKLATTQSVFTAIKAAKKYSARIGGTLMIAVGKGENNAVTKFGPGTLVNAEAIENIITTARAAIGDETADVELTYQKFAFGTGKDLEDFLSEAGEVKIDVSEVEQNG